MNRLPILTDSELSLLVNALHAAADEYERLSKEQQGSPRLDIQFMRQADETRALANRLEEESEDSE